MKTIVCIAISIILCSCYMNSTSLENENEQSISLFAKINQSNNCEILQKFKNPIIKMTYNDGTYSYHYNFKKFIDNNQNGIVTSSKEVFFTFKNNILHDIKFNIEDNQVDSKYKFIDVPDKPEFDIRYLSKNDFYRKINKGMKKGLLFRLVGKPKASYNNNNNEELWIFPIQFTRKEVKRHAAPLPDIKTEYRIVLKDNVVIDRYVGKEAKLTDAEKVCIGQ